MTSVGEASVPGPTLVGLEPIKSARSRWPALIGAVLTVAMVIGLARALFASGLAGLSRSVPVNPLFYVSFALLYMTLPIGDFLIFRRLWRIPAAGLAALIKKRIANEVVFGYSGEAYFYAWARARTTMVAAPFGAVKDVSILSAIAGNAITLAMLVVALPLGRGLLTPDQLSKATWSTLALVAISLPFLIFSKRVFSLPRRLLWQVFAIHCVRLLMGSLLITLAWHFALPGVPLGVLTFLAAIRLLVSRLPFVPNRETLFPLLAALVISEHGHLMQTLSLTGALFLVSHIAFIAAFGLFAAVTRRKLW